MTQEVMDFLRKVNTFNDYENAWEEWVDDNCDSFEVTQDLRPAVARMRGFWHLWESSEPDADGHYL